MQKLSLVRFRFCAWLCRTNASGPSPTVGAALAAARKPSPLKGEGGWPKARRMTAARKPSPLKGEGGWPKARRMRVLSRKVALRARESPSRYPSPAKVPPCQKGGAKRRGDSLSQRSFTACFFFFSVGAHSVRPRAGLGPAPTKRQTRFRIRRRGGPCAAARKPSPLKGEGGWPKARRMRVLSRKVALRARGSPSRYPSPAKVPPCQKGGRKAAWGFPLPEIIHGALLFSLYGRHTWAARRSPAPGGEIPTAPPAPPA